MPSYSYLDNDIRYAFYQRRRFSHGRRCDDSPAARRGGGVAAVVPRQRSGGKFFHYFGWLCDLGGPDSSSNFRHTDGLKTYLSWAHACMYNIAAYLKNEQNLDWVVRYCLISMRLPRRAAAMVVEVAHSASKFLYISRAVSYLYYLIQPKSKCEFVTYFDPIR